MLKERSAAGLSAERILVCLGPSPFGEGLLQEALRMARSSGAELWALFVDVPTARLDALSKAALEGNLRLAEELGVKLFIRSGEDIAVTVVDFARRHGVTRIVVGKPLAPRWKALFGGTLVDRMIRLSGPIDVVALSRADEERLSRPLTEGRKKVPWSYLGGAALVAVATVAGLPFSRVMSPTNIVMVYLAAVLVAALFLGQGPSILTAVLGVLAFDVFMVPPYYTLVVTDSQYLVTFAGFLGVGLVVSGLASRAREQAREARRREEETLALYAFSRDLASAAGRNELVRAVTDHLSRTLGWDSALFLADEGGGVVPLSGGPTFLPEPIVEAVGDVFRHGRSRELEGGLLCLPLKVKGRKVGVLALAPKEKGRSGRLRDAFVLQVAQALERIALDERALAAERVQVREKIQAALLNSISHEIRTPLSSITGVLSSLRRGEEAFVVDGEARSALIETAWSEAQRLNSLVGNLLNMSRLESGGLQTAPEPCDPAEIVAHALALMGERLEGRPVETELPGETCLVSVDFALFSLVLVNLLDNALKYGPPQSPLVLRVRREGEALLFEVLDRGPGIPEPFREKVFEKFFRLPSASGGTGLGLTICRGIVEAHGGTIEAVPRQGGGTAMTIRLPGVIEP